MNNLEIRKFEQDIIYYVNRSPLPEEVKRLVLLDVCRQVETVTNAALNEELLVRKKAESEEKEDEQNVSEN